MPDGLFESAEVPRPVRSIERLQRIVDTGILAELNKTELSTLLVYVARADVTTGNFCISSDYIGKRIGAKDRGRIAAARKRLVDLGLAVEHHRRGKGAPATELLALRPQTSEQTETTLSGAAARRRFRGASPVTTIVTGESRPTCHDDRDTKQDLPVTKIVSPPVTMIVASPVTTIVTQSGFLSDSLIGKHAAHAADPVPGPAAQAPMKLAAEKAGRESRHQSLIRTAAPYRQFTDFWVAEKRNEDPRYEFLPEDGVHLSHVWGAAKQDLLLAKAMVIAYFEDGAPFVEGHPAKKFRGDLDKYRSRAARGSINGPSRSGRRRPGEIPTNFPPIKIKTFG